MKHILTMGLAALLVQGVSAQNPIIRDQFSADPTARVFNGKVYLFPSHDISPLSAYDYPRKDWFCMNDYHVFLVGKPDRLDRPRRDSRPKKRALGQPDGL